MSERVIKRLVLPGLILISVALVIIGVILNILDEDVAFRAAYMAAFSMAGIYFCSLWKSKTIPRFWNLLALLVIGFYLLMLILLFFDIHILPQIRK